MKFLWAASLASLATMVMAVPSSKLRIQKRQSLNDWAPGRTCKGAIMFFARGTFEGGNVGSIIGPGVFTPLRRLYPDIAITGVKYPAAVGGNLTPAGADADGIRWTKDMFTKAASECPKAALVGGGYSQGAALMHRSIEALPKNVQSHIAAVVLYGDTKNKQDGGRIKNFPPEKVKIFCNKNDGVCGGALNVNAGHLSYTSSFQPGAEFIVQQIKAYKGSGGAGASESSGDSEGSAEPKASKSSGKGKEGKGAGKEGKAAGKGAGKSAAKGAGKG